MSYLKLKELTNFKVNNFVKKYWSYWNDAEKKFYRSDEYKDGYKPTYTFNVNNGDSLDVSRDQLGQMLIGCFEAKKTLSGSPFVVKTNGKTGLEIRYYINYDFKALTGGQTSSKKASTPQTTPTTPLKQEI